MAKRIIDGRAILGMLIGAAALVALFYPALVARATTYCFVPNGCTGTSTAPAYGQLLIGGKSGEYEYVASSSIGSGGGGGSVSSVFGRTGTITAQSGDYTTSLVPEGTNLYWTPIRFDNRLSATTSLPNLVTLANLGTVKTTLTGFLKAASGVLSTAAINLASDITGILPAANGGAGTVSGILKANGSGLVSAAAAGTDYQAPVTLTTSGTSGAATFVSNTLNIPQYAGTTYTGSYPVNVSGSVISFLGIGTTSNPVKGQLPVWTGTNSVGTVATGTISNGTGISVTGGQSVIGTGLTITNTAPDQTVTLTGSGGTSVTGTYPSFTVGSFGYPFTGNATTTSLAFNGGLTTSGATIGTLNGLLKAVSGVVSAAANGTDYSLITANTCGVGQHFSTVTASGIFTCTPDATSATGLASTTASGAWTPGNLATVFSNGALYGQATTSFTPSAEFTTTGTIGALVGGTNSTLSLATNGVALTKLAQIGANTVLANPTGATGNVQAVSTSSLGLFPNTFTLTPSTTPAVGAVQRTTLNKVSDLISVKDFGAKGDGTTDDTAAIQAAFTYASTTLSNMGTVYFPAGKYDVSSTLLANSSVKMDDGATIVATASMGDVVDLGNGASTTTLQNGNPGAPNTNIYKIVWDGGTIDGHDLTTGAVFHSFGTIFGPILKNMKVYNAPFIGFETDSQNTQASNIDIERSLGTVTPTTSTGIYAFESDSHFTDINVGYGVIGVDDEGPGNYWDDVHIYDHNLDLQTGLKVTKQQGKYQGCEVDKPNAYGVYDSGTNDWFTNCKINLKSPIPSGVAIGFYFPAAQFSQRVHTLIGNYVDGDATSLFASDYVATSTDLVYGYGNTSLSIVSPTGIGLWATATGTAAFPYYTFDTATTTGIYLAATTTPELGVSIGGTNVLDLKTATSTFSSALSVPNLAIGSLSGILKGIGGYVTTALVNLASDVTGILPLANGGTGIGSYSGNQILYTNAAGTALVQTATSTLSIGGTAANVTGTVAVANGGTNATSQATNGVAYYDGTKLTTGSLLTFDGALLTAGNASTTQIGSTGNAYLATAGGMVGIGTTSPQSMLSIVGTGSTDLFRLATSSATAPPLVSVDTNGFMTVDNTGSLNATGNPITAKQNNSAITTATNALMLSMNNDNQTNGNYALMGFKTISTTGLEQVEDKFGAYFPSHTQGSLSGGFVFTTRNGGALTDKMWITPSGQLGVGTSSASSQLTEDSTGGSSETPFYQVSNVNDFTQILTQNSNAGANSSAGFTVGNNEDPMNSGSPNHYVELGMDGSGFTGQPGYPFLVASSSGNPFQFANINAASDWQFLTGGNPGTLRLVVAHGGNVGVGTSTPWKLLSVGTSNVGTFAISTSTAGCAQFSALGELYSKGSACGSGTVTSVATDATLTGGAITTTGTLGLNLPNPNTWTGLQQFNGNASTTEFTSTGSSYLATTGGSVGIGTTSPTTLLSVSGTGNALATINASAANAAGYIQFQRQSSNFGFLGIENSTGSSFTTNGLGNAFVMRSAGPIELITNGNSALNGETISTAGFVGIGTTSPFASLSVQSNSSTVWPFALSTTTGKMIQWTDNKGEQYSAGDVPTFGTCGTSPTFAAGSNNNTGRMHTGTGVLTTCSFNFADSGWVDTANAPACTASVEGGGSTGVDASTTATAVLLTGTGSIANTFITYQCSGF